VNFLFYFFIFYPPFYFKKC